MNRRTLLASAAAAPLAAAAASVSAHPPAERHGPTVDDLINLAEHGGDPMYYGRLLGECLEETGMIAKDNGDGTISIYSAEFPREAWRKRTVLSSGRPIPAGLLQRFKQPNRGEDFPAGIPFRPLS